MEQQIEEAILAFRKRAAGFWKINEHYEQEISGQLVEFDAGERLVVKVDGEVVVDEPREG